MSAARRYPTAEAYEQRSPAFYANGGNRSHRSYDELDLDVSYPRHGDPRRSQPDFLREDYGRTSAGPLVVRSRDDDYERPPGRTRAREIEKDEVVIRERRGSAQAAPRGREVEREDIVFRRGESRSRPRQVEKEQTEVVIRRREEEERPPKPVPRPREYEREDIVFRRGEADRPRPREVEREEIRFRHGEMDRPPRGRNTEHEEIIFRRDERDEKGSTVRSRSVEREEFIYRRDEREDRPRERERERETVVFRPREKSQPPRGDLVAREREEFIVRRREAPQTTRETEKEEIIIRRTEQKAPTPPPEPEPEPEPAPPMEPIIRPPIIQEIITHHRHIDHGVERARSPSPPPPPPSPPKEESLEISVRRSNTHGKLYEDEIIFDRRETEITSPRPRSMSAPRRRSTIRNSELEAEAEFYNRKAQERGFIGEAYNGATKDWAIIDVPPGTERVRMDGVGGASQEVTWQRYNGVRRARFITDDGEFTSDFGAPARAPSPAPAPAPALTPPPSATAMTSDTRITIRKEETRSSTPSKTRASDMWTEITKDLVIKDAIDAMGYDYEETEYFFYVMEYLRYEDVLQLVELSDDIRRERRARLREIQWEREEIESRRKSTADERIFEREIIYDSRRGRYR